MASQILKTTFFAPLHSAHGFYNSSGLLTSAAYLPCDKKKVRTHIGLLDFFLHWINPRAHVIACKPVSYTHLTLPTIYSV